MKNSIFLLFYGLLFLACDDGNIYPKEKEDVEGQSATLHVHFTGQEAWPHSYKLVFAGFGTDTEVPLISKVISQPASDTAVQAITLNGLNSEIKSLSISLLGKGRNLIYNFYTFPLEGNTENITLPVEEIDLAGFPRVQAQVFDLYCTRCHGAGNHAAAGLDLTPEHSFASLVNTAAVNASPGMLRVTPGEPDKSFLHKILREDCIETYNHTDVLPEDELLVLIDTWIKNCK